jgi:hypothetical protein
MKKEQNLEDKDKAFHIADVMPRFSNDELKRMCNEMLFQIRGNYIEEHEQCEEQGHPDWQIAMYYFRKLNGSQ